MQEVSTKTNMSLQVRLAAKQPPKTKPRTASPSYHCQGSRHKTNHRTYGHAELFAIVQHFKLSFSCPNVNFFEVSLPCFDKNELSGLQVGVSFSSNLARLPVESGTTMHKRNCIRTAHVTVHKPSCTQPCSAHLVVRDEERAHACADN